uniref:Uncharacterized protein n=1 Tax=Cucumis melo TaxID=3656 RepID=A0A9I9E7N1_CUCME
MFSGPWVGYEAKATSHKNWLVCESTSSKEKKTKRQKKTKSYTFNATSTTWKYYDQELNVDEVKYSLYQHQIWRKYRTTAEMEETYKAAMVVAAAVGKRGKKVID